MTWLSAASLAMLSLSGILNAAVWASCGEGKFGALALLSSLGFIVVLAMQVTV